MLKLPWRLLYVVLGFVSSTQPTTNHDLTNILSSTRPSFCSSSKNHPEILQNTGLKNQDIWLDLIKLYTGNLMFLKTITVVINKNYDGEVADFLAENTLHITQQMQSYFQDKFNRLSPIEKQIVLQLSKFEKPISREELRQSLIQKSLTQKLNLSSVDFNNGLQSLQQRYLVGKQKEDKVMFSLSSVFREYVRNLN
ncbi:hypothetical protein [Anabaenopsis elenkinii]|uniref:Uncharacterized protein n=1 Tax=Anabaenopsis elenkinii CCIBt3563 TaxID=2779889 RepID=A0A7S6REF6_9CYAN|nr:hypothetical protein [Anabaenopsis elenkinii]QOV21313.1 hypothetical protein IM676_11065 [Anabaenopsis elenkinii CCIBt3563]QOV23255.1 hypothetical protein IM676_02650 [Anabaenopsis elenkinii CCIBt3563]